MHHLVLQYSVIHAGLQASTLSLTEPHLHGSTGSSTRASMICQSSSRCMFISVVYALMIALGVCAQEYRAHILVMMSAER